MFTINTLSFSKKLEKSGMQREVAEALALEIKEIQIESSKFLMVKNNIIENDQTKYFATKQDLQLATLTVIASVGALMFLIEMLLLHG